MLPMIKAIPTGTVRSYLQEIGNIPMLMSEPKIATQFECFPARIRQKEKRARAKLPSTFAGKNASCFLAFNILLVVLL